MNWIKDTLADTAGAAHGLRPVDLDAAGPDWPGPGPDESALMEDCG